MPGTYTNTFDEVQVGDIETSEALPGKRIQTARRRLAKGWYDRDELLDAVLEVLLQDVTPQR